MDIYKTFFRVLLFSVSVLLSFSSKAQVLLPDSTSAPDDSINNMAFPADTSQIHGIDTTMLPYNQDTVPLLQQNQSIQEPSFIPKPNKENYGTVTEIKKLEEYNPKETLKTLKKGDFGNPVNLEKDSTRWKTGAFLGLDVNQGTLTNWAAGGDNFSLSLRIKGNIYANYSDGRNSWDNNIDMSLGFLKTSSQGIRKSDDKLEIYSKYSYRFSKRWFFSVLLNFRSQFANGYNYPDDSSVVSHFLAPGNVLGSVGISYEPNKHFSVLLSPVTSRFVIVNDQRLANEGAFGVDKAIYVEVDDGYRYLVRAGKQLSYELGAYMSLLYDQEILKNINWKTRLELYSNYLENPQNIDIHWNSLLTFKVNKFISASLTTELIYDDNIKFITYAKNEDGSIQKDPETGEKVVVSSGPRIQFKELIGLGFAYEL